MSQEILEILESRLLRDRMAPMVIRANKAYPGRLVRTAALGPAARLALLGPLVHPVILEAMEATARAERLARQDHQDQADHQDQPDRPPR